MKIIFGLLIFQLISNSFGDIWPEVEITSEFSSNNSTVSVIPNIKPEFKFICTAPFPIQWKLHFGPEDDGNLGESRHVTNKRIVQDFRNLSTYIFQSELSIKYKGKCVSVTNFTCHSTSCTAIQQETHVLMTKINHKNQLLFNITKTFPLYAINMNSGYVNENCSKAVALFNSDAKDHLNNPCWNCINPVNNNAIQKTLATCHSSTECSHLYSRQNQGQYCTRYSNYSNMCDSSEDSFDFNPKLLLCHDKEPTLSINYFYGVFRGRTKNTTLPKPPIYMNWADVNKTEMVYALPSRNTIYHINETITFACEFSRYYFATGSWFGIFSNKSIAYLRGNEELPCIPNHGTSNCTNGTYWKGTYVSKIRLKLDKPGFHKVLCFGPVWNSTEWVNASFAFKVKSGECAKVISVQPEASGVFQVGETDRKLVCKFSGIPVPRARWILPDNNTNAHYKSVRVDNYTLELQFREVGYFSKGNYTCLVINCMGSDSKSYEIEEISSPLGIVTSINILIISCLVVVLLSIGTGIVVYYRRTIKTQKEQIRYLTETEVKEFLEGNPQILKSLRDNIFNRASSLEAIPYDHKFEIALSNLTIYEDYVLGMGVYGKVFKGSINSSDTANYTSLSQISQSYYVDLSQNLVVAVKVCKGNLNVQKFKALLTELKVMAYLGVHENIVSLIGGCTENIRNRELYIVMEYCYNGSLEEFLKENKTSFVDNTYEETDNEFTLHNLLQWACNIADGLEYIHSKRVIHADLATRNVLLTQDLQAKIGDFGLSRQLLESSVYTKTSDDLLPWKHMAIESLKYREFSVKSDYWAFGVTLWQLFSLGEEPYAGLHYSSSFASVLEQGLRLHKPQHASHQIYDYMMKCWSQESSNRPTPQEIKGVCSDYIITKL